MFYIWSYVLSSDCIGTAHTQQSRHVTATFAISWQVVHLQILVLWAHLQMRDVLVCGTVLNFQVVLCATVVSPLGPLLSMSVTPLIIWKVPGSENVRAMETGVVLFHSVLLVSCKCYLLCAESLQLWLVKSIFECTQLHSFIQSFSPVYRTFFCLFVQSVQHCSYMPKEGPIYMGPETLHKAMKLRALKD